MNISTCEHLGHLHCDSGLIVALWNLFVDDLDSKTRGNFHSEITEITTCYLLMLPNGMQHGSQDRRKIERGHSRPREEELSQPLIPLIPGKAYARILRPDVMEGTKDALCYTFHRRIHHNLQTVIR